MDTIGGGMVSPEGLEDLMVGVRGFEPLLFCVQ